MAFLIFIPALLFGTQATRQCASCIPLEDLVSEAYGVEIAIEFPKQGSRAKYYTGPRRLRSTMAQWNTSAQPTDHLNTALLCSPSSTNTLAYRLKYELLVVPQRQQQQQLPSSSPFAQGLFHYFTTALFRQNILRKRDSQQPITKEPPAPIHPNVKLFRADMEALAPFVNISSDQRSKVSISISIPGWLTGTEEVCQVAEAATSTFGRDFVTESHASASYTALGYELCRIDYGNFDCTGPGRIMTVDLQKNDLVVLSQIQTPLLHWATDPVTFSVSKGLSHSAKKEWINSFVSSQHPDMVMITGPGANEPHLLQAIQSSKASSLLINQSSVPADRVAAMGAAQVTKDNLERQIDDCGEFNECSIIRREADRIAGKLSPLKPSIWPAAGLHRYHDEL